MADTIRAAVKILRPYIEGGKIEGGLDAIISEYATTALFSVDANGKATSTMKQHVEDLRRRLVSHMAQKTFPTAIRLGRAAADPILRGTEGKTPKIDSLDDVKSALTLRGPAKRWARRELGLIRAAFVRNLSAETKTLAPQVEAAFMNAMRSHQGKREVVKELLKSELESRRYNRKVLADLTDANGRLRSAESEGNRKEITKARQDIKRANVRLGNAPSLLARFERNVVAHARNAIRQAAQTSQFAHFRNAGFQSFQWIAVNGTDACPQCAERHGLTKPASEWEGDGPGDGGTYCGDSCMCQLVPVEFTIGNDSLEEPIDVAPSPIEESPAVKNLPEVKHFAEPGFDKPGDLMSKAGLPDQAELQAGKLLNREQEQKLFRQYNYAKYKAEQARTAGHADEMQGWLGKSRQARDMIVDGNQRLVRSIAAKYAKGDPNLLADRISDGNMGLLRAVEKFDYRRGNRLSTYASSRIKGEVTRGMQAQTGPLVKQAPTEALDNLVAKAAGQESAVAARDAVKVGMKMLSAKEQAVIAARFGIGETQKELSEVAKLLNLSKQRVAQIEAQALKKLQRALR